MSIDYLERTLNDWLTALNEIQAFKVISSSTLRLAHIGTSDMINGTQRAVLTVRLTEID